MKTVCKYRDGAMETFDHVHAIGVQEPGLFILLNEDQKVIAYVPVMNVLSIMHPEKDVEPSGIITV